MHAWSNRIRMFLKSWRKEGNRRRKTGRGKKSRKGNGNNLKNQVINCTTRMEEVSTRYRDWVLFFLSSFLKSHFFLWYILYTSSDIPDSGTKAWVLPRRSIILRRHYLIFSNARACFSLKCRSCVGGTSTLFVSKNSLKVLPNQTNDFFSSKTCFAILQICARCGFLSTKCNGIVQS